MLPALRDAVLATLPPWRLGRSLHAGEVEERGTSGQASAAPRPSAPPPPPRRATSSSSSPSPLLLPPSPPPPPPPSRRTAPPIAPLTRCRRRSAGSRRPRWSSALAVSAAVALGCVTLSAPPASAQSSSSSSNDRRALFTKNVAYCGPPIAVSVRDLQLSFYPGNKTLSFSIDAESIQNNLNVSIALNLDVYGRSLLRANLDLCSFLGGILCPLPQYQFSGTGIYPLPDSLVSQVPDIAFGVPNLDAVAVVELRDVNTRDVVGCLQTTLSNGHTMRQAGAKWATVAVALLALASSLLHSAIAQSVGAAQWRVVDVMMAIQMPALTSLLSLNYPVAFLAFADNFVWSLGIANLKSLQTSLDSTRAKTGGHIQGIFGGRLASEYAARNNPFNRDTANVTAQASSTANSISFGLRRRVEDSAADVPLLKPITSSVRRLGVAAGEALQRRQLYAPNTGANGQLQQSTDQVDLPLLTNSALTEGEIGLVAQRSNVNPGNLFLTSLVCIAILLAIVVAALLLVYALAAAVRVVTRRRARQGRRGFVSPNHWSRRIMRFEDFSSLTLALVARWLLVVVPVVFVFGVYQWRYGDSWVPSLVAALVWLLSLLALAAFYLAAARHVRSAGGDARVLYAGDVPPAHAGVVVKRHGHLAQPYRPKFWWFSLVFVLYGFIRALIISLGQSNGTAQVITLLVFEFLLLVTLLFLRVGRDKKSDLVLLTLTFFRLAAWIVGVALTTKANLTWIPRIVVAFVLVVVTGLPVVLLFFLTLWDLVTPFLPSKRRDVAHHDDGATLEKGGATARRSRPEAVQFRYDETVTVNHPAHHHAAEHPTSSTTSSDSAGGSSSRTSREEHADLAAATGAPNVARGEA